MHGSWQSTDRSGVDAPVPGDPVGAVIESSPKPPARREFSFRASRQRAANRIEAGTQTDGDPQEGLRRAGNRGYAIRSAGRFWGETDPRMTVATTVWLAGYGRTETTTPLATVQSETLNCESLNNRARSSSIYQCHDGAISQQAGYRCHQSETG